ncbi:unnamed protein product, partial [Timema podura]|nr:unnamed protein product [Timema podura]
MCKAARVCIAEVEEIVPVGTISPDEVHVPGIYVDRIVKSDKCDKKIEKLTIQKEEGAASMTNLSPAAQMRERIIRRAALEFKDGMYGIL